MWSRVEGVTPGPLAGLQRPGTIADARLVECAVFSPGSPCGCAVLALVNRRVAAGVLGVSGAVLLLAWSSVTCGDPPTVVAPPTPASPTPPSVTPAAARAGASVAPTVSIDAGEEEEPLVEGRLIEDKTWTPIQTTVTLESGRGERRAITSGTAGRFSTQLPPGAWRVVETEEDFAPTPEQAALSVAPDQPTRGVHLRLARRRLLNGLVVDDAQVPLAGVEIEGARSDEQGRFTLRTARSPSGFRVSHPCCQPNHRWSLDREGVNLKVVLRRWKTPPLGTVTGEVVDAAGRPCVAQVAILGAQGAPSVHEATNPDGRFVLPLFAEGARVSAEAADAAAESAPVRVGEHVRLVLDCAAPAEAELSVRLVDEQGRPWTECVLAGDWGRAPRWSSDAQGRFAFRLPRAMTNLKFNCLGTTRSLLTHADLKRGDVALGERVLERGAHALSGTIFDRQTRAPIAGALIRDGNVVATVSDEAGAFALTVDLLPGQLRITAPGYRQLELQLPGDARTLSIDLAREADTEERREEYEGVGMGLVPMGRDERGGFQVTLLAPGGPAEQAGLRVGDALIAVDDVPTRGVVPVALHARIKGPSGSWVKLSLLREGHAFDVRVQRRRIER